MSCPRRDPALLLLAHGQLGGLQRAFLEAHLKGCASCRDRWTRAVMERDALRRALAPPAEVDAQAERLMNAVAVRIRTEPRDAPVPRAMGLRGSLAWPEGGFAWPRNGLVLVAISVLLALAFSAMAAYWGPGSPGRRARLKAGCPVLKAEGEAERGNVSKPIPPADTHACMRCHVDLNHPRELRR